MALRRKTLTTIADVRKWASTETAKTQERLFDEYRARDADPSNVLHHERVGRFEGYTLALNHLLDRLPKT